MSYTGEVLAPVLARGRARPSLTASGPARPRRSPTKVGAAERPAAPGR